MKPMNKKLMKAVRIVMIAVAAAALIVGMFSKGTSRLIMQISGLVFWLFLIFFTLWEMIAYFRERRDPKHPYNKHKKWLVILGSAAMIGLFLFGLFMVTVMFFDFFGHPLL